MGGAEPKFDWDDANRDHLARHHVRPEEAEQAVLDPHAIFVDIEVRGDDDEERTTTVGMTASGRVLAVVFTVRGEAVRPITAYAAPARLEALYFEQRRL